MSFFQKQDLKPEDFPELSWAAGSYGKSLSELCAYSSKQAEKAIDWYYKSRQARRYFCQLCRLGAILLTLLAGILPLANEIKMANQNPALHPAPATRIENQLTAPSIPTTNAISVAPTPTSGSLQLEAARGRSYFLHPLWSAIAVAIAGGLILIDRFYGFTTGWIRYLLTVQKLTNALDVFRIEQQRQKVSWGNPEPTQIQTAALISTIQQFLEQIRAIVNDETKAWAADFADALKQIDEQVKVAAQATQKSALQITVTNGDQSTAGWALVIGERPPETKLGREASVEVVPGMYIVRAAGQIGAKQVQAEQPIKIGPGEIGRLTLTLT